MSESKPNKTNPDPEDQTNTTTTTTTTTTTVLDSNLDSPTQPPTNTSRNTSKTNQHEKVQPRKGKSQANTSSDEFDPSKVDFEAVQAWLHAWFSEHEDLPEDSVTLLTVGLIKTFGLPLEAAISIVEGVFKSIAGSDFEDEDEDDIWPDDEDLDDEDEDEDLDDYEFDDDMFFDGEGEDGGFLSHLDDKRASRINDLLDMIEGEGLLDYLISEGEDDILQYLMDMRSGEGDDGFDENDPEEEKSEAYDTDFMRFMAGTAQK